MLGEGAEAAHVAEQDGDGAPVAVEQVLVTGGDHEPRDLRRQKALEAGDALDFGDLLADPLLEGAIPLREVGGLRDGLVVQRLEPQHRTHARHQRRLVDGLGQIFVGPRLEPRDDVPRVGFRRDEDDRHERKRRIVLQQAADVEAVHLRHHDVEQHEVRNEGPRCGERLLAVRRLAAGRSRERRDASRGCRDWSRCRRRSECVPGRASLGPKNELNWRIDEFSRAAPAGLKGFAT